MKKRMFLFLGVVYAVILGGCNQEKERVGEYRIEDGKMIFQTLPISVVEITLKIVATTIEGDTISGDWISLTKK